AIVTGDAVHDTITTDTTHVVVETGGRLINGPHSNLGPSRPDRHDVLYVGVSGPVVACEEVNIKHMGYGQYSISYTVRDRGRHLIMIKWGEQHVPGSPFTVDVI
ncbi:unnamed protein product, partial [Schistosoma mattheei]